MMTSGALVGAVRMRSPCGKDAWARPVDVEWLKQGGWEPISDIVSLDVLLPVAAPSHNVADAVL